jgi:hypothetical protein
MVAWLEEGANRVSGILPVHLAELPVIADVSNELILMKFQLISFMIQPIL